MNKTAADFIKELDAEAVSTRKCLANITDESLQFKPHPTSMTMLYLASLVAEIPLWITYMVTEGEVDFATFKHADIKTSQDLLDNFDKNIKDAVDALKNAPPENFEKMFYLRSKGEELFSEKVSDYIGPTINHWVHHRGQLTVYMRMCSIKVPSIYGPSADDKNY